MRTKKWYRIEYTRYIHWLAIEGKMGEHTTWVIDEYFTESIRKAKKFIKEHQDGRLTVVYR